MTDSFSTILTFYVPVCVCLFMYESAYMCVYMCMFANAFVHMCVCVCAFVYVCARVFVSVCVYACVCLFDCVCVHVMFSSACNLHKFRVFSWNKYLYDLGILSCLIYSVLFLGIVSS